MKKAEIVSALPTHLLRVVLNVADSSDKWTIALQIASNNLEET